MCDSTTKAQEPIDEPEHHLFNHLADQNTNRLTQILTGLPVGHDETVACTACQQPIPEGTPVTLYAYRSCGDTNWCIPRVFCREDVPTITGTLGVWDALAEARIGTLSDVTTQSYRAALLDPTITTMRTPTQGTVVYSPFRTQEDQR